MQRRLAAVLNADLVGYSRLMSKDEAGTLITLKAYEIGVIDPTVAKHGGRIVKRMGDGYLAEFASVVDAVECALSWQRQSPMEGDRPLKFRIGVHLGDIIAEGHLWRRRQYCFAARGAIPARLYHDLRRCVPAGTRSCKGRVS